MAARVAFHGALSLILRALTRPTRQLGRARGPRTRPSSAHRARFDAATARTRSTSASARCWLAPRTRSRTVNCSGRLRRRRARGEFAAASSLLLARLGGRQSLRALSSSTSKLLVTSARSALARHAPLSHAAARGPSRIDGRARARRRIACSSRARRDSRTRSPSPFGAQLRSLCDWALVALRLAADLLDERALAESGAPLAALGAAAGLAKFLLPRRGRFVRTSTDLNAVMPRPELTSACAVAFSRKPDLRALRTCSPHAATHPRLLQRVREHLVARARLLGSRTRASRLRRAPCAPRRRQRPDRRPAPTASRRAISQPPLAPQTSGAAADTAAARPAKTPLTVLSPSVNLSDHLSR